MWQKISWWLMKWPKSFWLIFLLLQIYLWVFVFIPFLFNDQLQLWDTPGHLYAAQYLRENFFPNYTGWNPQFYAGWPQDTFYPPLYHYLIALLSFILGYIWSIKLIMVLSVAVLPISFYYFARKLQFSQPESALVMGAMMLPILTMVLQTGGTLYSQFYVGLGSNSLALPLLFFFIGKLQAGVSHQNRWSLVWLLAGIILTHFVVALAALFFWLIYLVVSGNPAQWRESLIVGGLAGGLTAGWLLPFLWLLPWYGGSFLTVEISYFILWPTLCLVVGGLLLSLQDKDWRLLKFPLVSLVVFALLYSFDWQNLGIAIHSYRFILYFVLFGFLFTAKIFLPVTPTKSWRYYLRYGAAALLIIYLIIIIRQPILEVARNQNSLYRWLNFNAPFTNTALALPQLDGRLIVYDGDRIPYIHDLRQGLAGAHPDLGQTRGLFVEGSKNSPFINSLDFNVNGNGFSWGVPPALMGTSTVLTTDDKVIQKNLDLFNINFLLTTAELKVAKSLGQNLVRQGWPPYWLYQVGQSQPVDLLISQPQQVSGDWDLALREWWKSPERVILVKEQVPSGVASLSDKYQILEQSPTHDYLKIKIEANQAVPILIKESYFPRWSATVNGQPAKIYLAAPYLMLVYGQGVVELKYTNRWYDAVGWLVSVVTIAVYLITLKRSNKKITVAS